jgi:hypothetical protein
MQSELFLESQFAVLYLPADEGKNFPELLLFDEQLIQGSGSKQARSGYRRFLDRIKERYDQIACESFAGDRFVRRLRDFKKMTVFLNGPIEPAVVKQRLKQMLRDRSYHHLRWLVIDLLLLPVSLLAMPLPGPNLWGYYLLVRVYTHWKAYRSASQTTLDDLDVRINPRATEVADSFQQNKDVRSVLQELRQKYGLRALQEHKFIPHTAVLKDLWLNRKNKPASADC